MRRRIVLWLYMEDCYFEPDEDRIMEYETDEKKKKLMGLKKKKQTKKRSRNRNE